MTNFEVSCGGRCQEGLSCVCHIVDSSTHCKYDFIPFTSRHSPSTWTLKTGHIALTAALSKTERSILHVECCTQHKT